MATDKAIKAFDAEIKRLLKTGKTPKEAVNEAYKLYPVMKIMQGEIEPQLIGEMKRGGAVGVAKPLLKKRLLRYGLLTDWRCQREQRRGQKKLQSKPPRLLPKR